MIYTTEQMCATQTHKKHLRGKGLNSWIFHQLHPYQQYCRHPHHTPLFFLMLEKILHHLHNTVWPAQEYDQIYYKNEVAIKKKSGMHCNQYLKTAEFH